MRTPRLKTGSFNVSSLAILLLGLCLAIGGVQGAFASPWQGGDANGDANGDAIHVGQVAERQPSDEAAFFLVRQKVGASQVLVVYRASSIGVTKLGERNLKSSVKVPMAWLDEQTFWVAETRAGLTTVSIHQIEWDGEEAGNVQWGKGQALPGRLLDHSTTGCLLIEPLTVWFSPVLAMTPFSGGAAHETAVRVHVGTVTAEGVSIDRRAWLPPLLETPRQRQIGKLKYRTREGCPKGKPCAADQDWAEAMVRVPGDDVLVPELTTNAQGASQVSICLRSSGLGSSGGTCIHTIEKPLFRLGGVASGGDRKKPTPTRPEASWLRLQPGVHQCTENNQTLQWKWPTPPPDVENFCYGLVADGAGIEVGTEEFPHVWSEESEDVVVRESWSHWMGNTWILSRERDLCGGAPEEMDGDCSCTTHYLFDGCSSGPSAFFLERSPGPGHFWSHPTGTKPSEHRYTIRLEAREVGVVDSWNGVLFAPDLSVPRPE